ncbi:Zn(II)2Cys6 transcription factor domain-containing protein, partial [Aspergillus homomorphus CBS 101889]
RARRSHTKSRSGCLNCKQRRVKCDEKKPICSNCHMRSMTCDYPNLDKAKQSPGDPASARPSTSDTRTTSQSIDPSCVQGKGRIYARPVELMTAETHDPCSREHRASPQEIPMGEGLSFADLELFHHFATSTYRTLANEVEGASIWQQDVLRWSMAFPFMLRLVLALSALHLSHESSPTQGQIRQTQADDHFACGVPAVVSIVSNLDTASCQRAYISAVMICFIYLARGPWPGQYLLFSDHGRAEWWLLVQGIRLIVGSYREHVFSGALATERTGDCQMLYIGALSARELCEHKLHVHSLRQLVDHSVADCAQRASYILAIDLLLQQLDGVHLKRPGRGETPVFVHVIIEWMLQLPENFVLLVEQQRPVAMVILAHWTILLRYVSSVWYLKGWSEHILVGIGDSLEDGLRPWIEWPL